MKKLLASVLAVLMLLMCIPLGAVSVSAYTQGIDGLGPVLIEGGRRDFKWPVPGHYNLQSCFYDQRNHCAIDISAPKNTAVIASYAGTVIKAVDGGESYYGDGFGNYVVLQHSYQAFNGTVTLYSRYSHLNSVSVKEGSTVHAGDTIGKVGTSGSSEGYHLDFQILYGGWAPYQTYSIDPYANQVLELPTNLVVYDSWSCGKDYFALIKEIYATPNIIAESFKSHCVVKVTKATTIKSLPCSKETDPNSADVETPKVGDYYKAIALHRNTTKAGNLWYEVETKSGGTGYLFAGNTEYYGQSTSDVTLSGVVAPTTIKQGSAFAIGGTVTAQYQQLVDVCAWVENYLGHPVIGKCVEVNGTSYNLKGSTLDNALTFNTLAAAQYSYWVSATVKTYYASDATTVSTRQKTIGLHESSFSVEKDTACKHSYTSTVKNPTCTEGGYTAYTCTLCGYAYSDNHTNALGCDYETAVTKPSCTGQGYTTAVCRRCGKTETGDYVDPTGHMYDILEIPATCTQPGKRCYTCAFCGDYYEETVTSYVSEWSTEYPDVDDSAIIESKQQYRWRTEEWTESTESSLSGWTLSDSYTRWGEYGAWSDWGNDAISGNDATQVETRTAYAYYYYKCPGCGAHMHGWGITCPTWAGGCGKATIRSSDYVWVYSTTSYTAAGLKEFYGTGKYYATVDGMVAFQHDKGQVTQYRSRTRALETVYRFYRYSDWTEWSDTYDASAFQMEERTVYRYILAQTARHTYSGQVTTAATCGADGVMTYTCIACGDSYTEAIPATGNHTYDDDYDADCNGCGSIRTVPEKPPVTPDLPADAPTFVVESASARAGEEFTIAIRTQRNSGIVSFKLQVAYDADVLELVALEEKDFTNMTFSPLTNNPFIINWVDAINPNNSTDGVMVLATFRVKDGAPLGVTDITLTYDAEDVYDQNFENVGFRIENGIVEIVDYTHGDANGDGKINNKDLGLLQQHLNGWNVAVVHKAADANGDGRVNNKDLGLLQQYLNGWSVELG